MLCRQLIYKFGEDFLAVLGAIQFNLKNKCTPPLKYMLVYISIELYHIRYKKSRDPIRHKWFVFL